MDLTRRQRYRAETLAEIKQLALRQIAAGGIEALSLNAIARDMAVSGAALYRYFTSRDDLLADLVVDAYTDLAAVLEAVAAAQYPSPRARMCAITDAYRTWALDQPHRYRLAFSSPIGSGQLAPERVIPAAQHSMNVFLGAVSTIAAGKKAPRNGVPAELDAPLQAWHRRSGGPALPSATLLRGIRCWTRLHGVLSLELDGHLISAGLDPGLLYKAEVDSLIADIA
ncbi:MAG: TetR/AcrR family transcriptional regulator [Chloroflexota bacterium]|nr:TetR/AcrR family transcriptional regulator [Chloroflexota bacterium]